MTKSSAYLKHELGIALSQGITATVLASPSNPTEYLGLWLLHYLQRQERVQIDDRLRQTYEAELSKLVDKEKLRLEGATRLLQREWRRHLRQLEVAAHDEAQLQRHREDIAAALNAARVDPSSDKSEEEPSSDATSSSPNARLNTQLPRREERGDVHEELDALLEEEALTLEQQFHRSSAFLKVVPLSLLSSIRLNCVGTGGIDGRSKLLEKEVVRGEERSDKECQKSASAEAVRTVLRCVLYAQGYLPSAVRTAGQIRQRFYPLHFLRWSARFNPFATFADAAHPSGLSTLRGERENSERAAHGKDTWGVSPFLEAVDSRVGPTLHDGGGVVRGRRAMERVRRLLSLLDGEEVRTISLGLFAVYEWLYAAVRWRRVVDEWKLAREESGRQREGLEVEAEEDGDPSMGEDVDDEEERIKEAERKQAEERRLEDEVHREDSTETESRE